MFNRDVKEYIKSTNETIKAIEDFNETSGKISPALYKFLKEKMGIIKTNLREIKKLDCETISFYDKRRTKIRKTMKEVNKILNLAQKLCDQRLQELENDKRGK